MARLGVAWSTLLALLLAAALLGLCTVPAALSPFSAGSAVRRSRDGVATRQEQGGAKSAASAEGGTGRAGNLLASAKRGLAGMLGGVGRGPPGREGTASASLVGVGGRLSMRRSLARGKEHALVRSSAGDDELDDYGDDEDADEALAPPARLASVVARAPARGSSLLPLPARDSPAPAVCRIPAFEPAAGVSKLVWRPKEGRQRKYLLMFCFRNQISNLVRCMQNHLLAAGLLNRTLIIPTHIPFSDRNLTLGADWNSTGGVVFDLRVLWDLEHTRACLGPDRVVTFQEYQTLAQDDGAASTRHGVDAAKQVKRAHAGLRVDLVQCWFGKAALCGFADQAESNCPVRPGPNQTLEVRTDMFEGRLDFVDKRLLEHAPASASCMPHSANLSTFMAHYAAPESAAADARVLVMGDLVNMQLTGSALLSADTPGQDPFVRERGCPNRLLIQPPLALMEQARRQTQRLFGGHPFLALHWRRGDFVEFCTWLPNNMRCTYTAPQAASCLADTLRRHNLTRIFLATNAAAREVIQLRRRLAMELGTEVHVYQQRSSATQGSQEEWASALAALGIDVQQQRLLAEVALDKTMSALARVFVGSPESTFTQDIRRLRLGLGLDSSCDAELCAGQDQWDKDRVQEAERSTRFQ